MTVITDRLAEVLNLQAGAHENPEEGMCLLEAAAYVAGETHTDHPGCVSPILGAYGRALNDALPEARRQELVPLVPRLVGTAGDGQDQTRGLLPADWLIRTYTPAFLRLVPGLVEHADALVGLDELTSWDDIERVTRELLNPARKDAARIAAGDAAAAAAGDAAWDAAGATLRPTVDELQASAVALLDRMIDPAREDQ